MTLGHGFELKILPQQAICHLWMTPHRLMCLPPFRSASSFCQGETYDNNGQPWWVRFGEVVADFIERKHLLVQVPLLAVILVCLAMAVLTETLLNASVLTTTNCVAALGVMYCIHRSSLFGAKSTAETGRQSRRAKGK